MLRSLFTGISGLNAHQQMLDVVADNIANVNTTGYKSSSSVFAETLSQTMTGATAPNISGGRNAIQVGLGVHLTGTAMNFTEGSAQTTGVPSNLMLNGDGMFVVNKNGQEMFTRAGAFALDSVGHLVTPDGAEVEDVNGSVLTLTGLTDGTYSSYSIAADGSINAVDSTGTITTIGQVGVATFANYDGLQKAGDTEFLPTVNSGAASIGVAGTGSRATLSAGQVEMSNVDLSKELTGLIVAERGFQANSKVITTSDEILQTLVNLKS
jgi:flagellar hook protein FlgE